MKATLRRSVSRTKSNEREAKRGAMLQINCFGSRLNAICAVSAALFACSCGSSNGAGTNAGGTSGVGGNTADNATGGSVGLATSTSDSSAGTSGACPVPIALQSGTDSVSFLAGVMVGTLVGSSEAGTADGNAATARFSNPVSIARVNDSMFIVADYDSSLLRQVDVGTGAVRTLTAVSSLSQPYGLALVNSVLFAHTDKNSLGAKDPSTGTIWSIDLSLGTETILAEDIGRPRAFAGLGSSQLLVGDDAHHVVSKFNLSSKALDLVAGVRDCGGYADGQSFNALFNGPAGVVVRSDGAFIVADAGNARIRLITTAGTVSTLAGDGVAATVDGPANTARFVHPRAIAIDALDNLYVSDDGAHRIRRVDNQGIVVTIAGAGSSVNAFADGSGDTAQFAGQEGIAVSRDGKTIYVADGTGGSEVANQQVFHRIRVVTLP